ncbi:hypothetical protein BDN72DRAFT_241214 [Pluteus cervinus]|uniref:Uncharacterized protein n=1 Tax=Pluteus cervinus TaxID=181527 RepID=A0ACD3BFJ6_9AGAR|nr:hypothetical protein BDN72DRAFT_241214 [Pluteus cervinus]
MDWWAVGRVTRLCSCFSVAFPTRVLPFPSSGSLFGVGLEESHDFWVSFEATLLVPAWLSVRRWKKLLIQPEGEKLRVAESLATANKWRGRIRKTDKAKRRQIGMDQHEAYTTVLGSELDGKAITRVLNIL